MSSLIKKSTISLAVYARLKIHLSFSPFVFAEFMQLVGQYIVVAFGVTTESFFYEPARQKTQCREIQVIQ